MGHADYLELGDWNARCSMCNRKRKASELVKNWQGMWRCPDHDEPRHPQDFVRGTPDIQTPAWTQPLQATSANGLAFLSITKSASSVDLCDLFFATHGTLSNVKTLVVTIGPGATGKQVLLGSLVVRNCFPPATSIIVRNDGIFGGVVNPFSYPVTLIGTTLPPDSIAFQTIPPGSKAGSIIDPPIVVELMNGNLHIPETGRLVTIKLGHNPSGVTLVGVTERETVAGRANFPGLVIGRAGDGYTFIATSGSFVTESQPYTIT